MAVNNIIKKLEADLWASADYLRSNANLNANEYCMPVLGLLFLKYAFIRFKKVEAEILKNRPTRGGRVMPVEAADFKAKSAIFLPREAQYDFLLNLPENPVNAGVKNAEGETLNSLGDIVNNAMRLIEENTTQLNGVLPRTYHIFSNEVLNGLLRIFNNNLLDEVGGDVIGRIYEYFLGKFSKNIADGDGVFFTPKSLVQMIVNIIEPQHGVVLDPACGSGGMFVQSGDFVNLLGLNANSALTFYGQEKVDYNAKLCLMNMAVHGLNAQIKSGDEANTFARDAHNLEGLCDYVMANPPFNVKKVKKATVTNSGRLPFGLPSVNDAEEISNANYLWIQYFYAYLNENGRAGFVMASSATDSQHRESEIREELVKTGDVDVMISVGNNFFYTLTLPCTLWFFDKAKPAERKDKILFIDARNYYTVVDRTLNEWNDWQIKNLNAIVWLYRGETDRYKALIRQYNSWLGNFVETHDNEWLHPDPATPASIRDGIDCSLGQFKKHLKELEAKHKAATKRADKAEIKAIIDETSSIIAECTEALEVANQLVWLTDKFGEDGTYNDVAGLCKIATLVDVEAKKFSLTPGAYVGVAEQEHDGVDFSKRMAEIHQELSELQKESAALFAEIQANQSELWK